MGVVPGVIVAVVIEALVVEEAFENVATDSYYGLVSELVVLAAVHGADTYAPELRRGGYLLRHRAAAAVAGVEASRRGGRVV